MYKTLFIILGLSMIQTAFGQTTCTRQNEGAREKPAYFAALAKISADCPKLAAYPETVRKGIDFLKKTDLAALPMGRTDIDGDNIYVNKMEYTTKTVEQATPEAHRQYIDIQFLLEGEELIGVIPYSDELTVAKEYVADNDILFFEAATMPFLASSEKSPNRLELHAGDLAIFTPSDVHAPSLALEKPAKVVKLVVKCRITE